MAEATPVIDAGTVLLTAGAAVAAGEVWQMADGRAAYLPAANGVSSGSRAAFRADGQVTLPKTAGIVLLDGGRAFWDHSANAVTYKKLNDRDFYLGRVVNDAASADTTCVVNLNVDPRYDLDLSRDPYLSVLVGTPAAGGFGYPVPHGGALVLELDATSEAQKADALSVDGFATGANAIIEGAFRVLADGSGSGPDLSLGVANATHASDADSITESLFVHLNGNDLNVYAESDDGTTEVNATDTTVDYVEGGAAANRVEFWLDMRDPTSCKVYLNGIRVLSGSTFNVNAAAGPWFLLAHLEKTSGTDTYRVAVDWLRARFAQQ